MGLVPEYRMSKMYHGPPARVLSLCLSDGGLSVVFQQRGSDNQKEWSVSDKRCKDGSKKLDAELFQDDRATSTLIFCLNSPL